MPAVAVNTYTHSVTYVADNILKSFKDIINLSGLDPSKFVGDWQTNLRGIRCWLESRHLRTVFLEIYDPRTDKLITRWDMDVVYSWGTGDGSFYTDTDQIRYAIRKVGLIPSQALYKLQFNCADGWPDVPGWSRTGRHRSTAGMVRQSLGSTIEHYGLGSSTAYWRNS